MARALHPKLRFIPLITVVLVLSVACASERPFTNDGLVIEAVAPTPVLTAPPPAPVTSAVIQPTPDPTRTADARPAGTSPESADCRTARPAVSVSATNQARITPPQNVPDPRGMPPSVMTQDVALLNRLKALLGDDKDSTSFVVKNLQTNRGVSYNENQLHYTASLYKLFVMFEVFHQEALGLLPTDSRLVMTPYYDDFGLSPRMTTLCQQLTIDNALQAMMSISDNAAAVLLQDVVGSANINDSMAALGLKSTEMTEDALQTTAADVATLMEGIARRQAVSPAASEEMMRLMTSEQFDNGLRAGVPDNVLVAHKTGHWGASTNDAGLVFAPNGTYLVVVLSEADDAQHITKEVSHVVYEYFTKGALPPANTSLGVTAGR